MSEKDDAQASYVAAQLDAGAFPDLVAALQKISDETKRYEYAVGYRSLLRRISAPELLSLLEQFTTEFASHRFAIMRLYSSQLKIAGLENWLVFCKNLVSMRSTWDEKCKFSAFELFFNIFSLSEPFYERVSCQRVVDLLCCFAQDVYKKKILVCVMRMRPHLCDPGSKQEIVDTFGDDGPWKECATFSLYQENSVDVDVEKEWEKTIGAEGEDDVDDCEDENDEGHPIMHVSTEVDEICKKHSKKNAAKRRFPEIRKEDREVANVSLGEKACVVCCTRKAGKIAVVDCGHVNICNVCVRELVSCPTCRAKITHAIRLYT